MAESGKTCSQSARYQFDQHLTGALFNQKCFEQLSSAHSLALKIFWQKIISAKVAYYY